MTKIFRSFSYFCLFLKLQVTVVSHDQDSNPPYLYITRSSMQAISTTDALHVFNMKVFSQYSSYIVGYHY